MNPIQQAEKALWTLTEHAALYYGEQHNTVIEGRAALTSLRSLQKEAEGVELLPLPKPPARRAMSDFKYTEADLKAFGHDSVLMTLGLHPAALAGDHYPLPDGLYPGSKDWVSSSYGGRVAWLHAMYEAKAKEAEMWLDQCNEAAALGRGVVPQDATKQMLAAACEVDWSNEDADAVAQNIWHAMLSAAPSPEATQPTQADTLQRVHIHLANQHQYSRDEFCAKLAEILAEQPTQAEAPSEPHPPSRRCMCEQCRPSFQDEATQPTQAEAPSERESAKALRSVLGCFSAAETEGLSTVLAETRDERLKDLVERRLMWAADFARAALATQQAGPDSYESIWNALQRIDSVAAMLPTYTVDHDGGIEAFTQNIVDAITRITPPAPGQVEEHTATLRDEFLAVKRLPQEWKIVAAMIGEGVTVLQSHIEHALEANGQVERDREDVVLFRFLCERNGQPFRDSVANQYAAGLSMGLPDAIRAARSREGGGNEHSR